MPTYQFTNKGLKRGVNIVNTWNNTEVSNTDLVLVAMVCSNVRNIRNTQSLNEIQMKMTEKFLTRAERLCKFNDWDKENLDEMSWNWKTYEKKQN